MKYDITTNKAPVMPTLGKGTECIRLLLSQATKDMHEPLVPMLFPSLAAHISGAEFQYPDRSWKETCGLMANLVGDSGCNKGQLTDITEAICRDFRQHDKAEMEKLRDAFNEAQLQAVRTEADKAPEGTKAQLSTWMTRGFITYSNQTGLYSKTEEYLKK